MNATTPSVEENLTWLRDWLRGPLAELVAEPDAIRWTFPYGGEDLVILARNEAALAMVARALHVGRTRRTGRRGARRWQVSLRPAAQLPCPAVPVKPSAARRRPH